MVSLMARNSCRTWLTTVTNTGQPNTAVAGSQRTLVLYNGYLGQELMPVLGFKTLRALL